MKSSRDIKSYSGGADDVGFFYGFQDCFENWIYVAVSIDWPKFHIIYNWQIPPIYKIYCNPKYMSQWNVLIIVYILYTRIHNNDVGVWLVVLYLDCNMGMFEFCVSSLCLQYMSLWVVTLT